MAAAKTEGSWGVSGATALKVVRFYIVLGSAWIIASDSLVLMDHGQTIGAAATAIVKGLVFVLVTAALLYVFMTRWVKESEAVGDRLRHFSRYANDIVLTSDIDGRLIDVNDRAVEIYGYPRPVLLGMRGFQLREDDRDWQADWDRVQRQGHIRLETRHRKADGTVFPVEISSRLTGSEGHRVVQSVVSDISERKEAERQITRLKDVYAALSQTNQCIVRVSSRDELFRAICRIVVRHGHFRFAWIGVSDGRPDVLIPVAWSDGVSVQANPAGAIAPPLMAEAVSAASSGKARILNDFCSGAVSEEPGPAPAGTKSSGSFPLHCRGGVAGVLSLHSDEAGFFTADLIELLDEVASDVSFALDRIEMERELRTLSMAVEQSPVTIVITDVQGNIQYVNPAFTATSGYLPAEVLGKNPRLLKSGETPEEEYAALWRGITGGTPWFGLFRNRRKDGSLYWEEAVIAPVRNADGEISQFIGVKQDITKRREAEANAAFLTYHDALTKLPNRVLCRDRMERAIAEAHRSRARAALLLVNLDHFKRVNESLGATGGDALLQAEVERIRACIRETDTLGRLGSDEFVIVLPGLGDSEAINRIASDILDRTLASFDIDGAELSITASVGIALYPDDGESFDVLLRNAGTAMRHAKDSGRNTHRFFADPMNVDADEYLDLLNGLRKALDRGEFALHYQPQISLASGQVVGAEALIRWNRPAEGMIPPGRFIAIAEDSGLIVEMGGWVLREAARQAAAWRDRGLRDLVVAVNLSAVQFKRGGLVETVRQALVDSGLPPACLELELTESILLKETANVLATVRQLKALGVRLSIDDFGTGYSSMAYLRRLDLDRLKIDRSFVRDIATNHDNELIVKAITQLAQGLGLKTVAEGVEDADAMAVICRHGCDEVQGYYFAKPMPADEFAAFSERWPQRARPRLAAKRRGREWWQERRPKRPAGPGPYGLSGS